MTDYVYAANDGMVANNATGGSVFLRPGDVWFADDPFVQSRPELFSATPTVVHSVDGRHAPDATPLGGAPKQRAESYARAKRA